MAESTVVTSENKIWTGFDKTDVYESVIHHQVEELIKTCTVYRIPVFVAVCTANNRDSSTYQYDGISPEGLNLSLSDDFFGKMLCVIRGFDAVPPVRTDPEEDNEEGEIMNVGRFSAEKFEEEDE